MSCFSKFLLEIPTKGLGWIYLEETDGMDKAVGVHEWQFLEHLR